MGCTSNSVLYLDFGDNVSLLGILKYIPILWGPTSRANFFAAFFYIGRVGTIEIEIRGRGQPSDGRQKKLRAPKATKVFICCFGDIIK